MIETPVAIELRNKKASLIGSIHDRQRQLGLRKLTSFDTLYDMSLASLEGADHTLDDAQKRLLEQHA